MYKSLVVFGQTQTIFSMVAKRVEYWFFVGFHVTMVTLATTGSFDTKELENINWETVNAMQFFLTFSLTFYNGQCFDRYLRLYGLCMQLVTAVLLFVHEIVTALPHVELENHRTCATKYMVSLAYWYFLSLSRGVLSSRDWRQLVRKGLLTRNEADVLASFPAHSHEPAFVLVTWTMRIVDEALQHDLMSPELDERAMRIAHCHNRAYAHCVRALSACSEMTSDLAAPIPFPYFNLMNGVLLFNSFVLCTICAVFKTYMTVFPLGAALLFFMGLREISSALADPFGADDTDFPLSAFMEYTFDNAICLLESFRSPEAMRAKRILGRYQEFTDEQFRMQVRSREVYLKNYDPLTSNPFAWSKEMPLKSLARTEDGPSERLKTIVVNADRKPVKAIGGHGGDDEIVIESDEEDEDNDGEEKEEENEKPRVERVAEWLDSKVAGFRAWTVEYFDLNREERDEDEVSQQDREATERRKHKQEREREKLQTELQAVLHRNTALEVELNELLERARCHRMGAIHATDVANLNDADMVETLDQSSPVSSGALTFDDPRTHAASREHVCAIIAFCYPGQEEVCDTICGAPFLSNFWQVAGGIGLEAGGTHKRFQNAEAAFQALKFWSRANEFENLTGEAALSKANALTGEEDLSHAGCETEWDAMLMVLYAKFARGSEMAQALLGTGDGFLLEHNSEPGHDSEGEMRTGKAGNWLGIQLMVVRDVISDLKNPKRWTRYLSDLIQVETGEPHSLASAAQWHTACRSATRAVVQGIDAHIAARKTPMQEFEGARVSIQRYVEEVD